MSPPSPPPHRHNSTEIFNNAEAEGAIAVIPTLSCRHGVDDCPIPCQHQREEDSSGDEAEIGDEGAVQKRTPAGRKSGFLVVSARPLGCATQARIYNSGYRGNHRDLEVRREEQEGEMQTKA